MIISIHASGFVVVKCRAYTESIVCLKSALSITHYGFVYSGAHNKPKFQLPAKHFSAETHSSPSHTKAAIYLTGTISARIFHNIELPAQSHFVTQGHNYFITFVLG